MRGSAAFRVAVAPGGALAGPWVRNSLWTAARAVPSLDLRFADNKSLVDATTGAQLVTFTRASSGTFVGSDGLLQTAVTNLVLRSEEFNDAAWTKDGASISSNSVVAPNGQLTADTLVENNLNAAHFVQSSTLVATSGILHTFSVYAKAGTRSRLELLGFALSLTGRGFDLSNGTTFANTAGLGEPSSFSIQPVGDGWYRCSITGSGNGLSSTVRAYLNNGTSYAYTGDGTSGLFIWGAQVEASSTAGDYVPTTSVINSAPRFDHNPTTGESLGLLVEEARTNSIRNNTMVGAVAGTPGTLPTNWQASVTAGLTTNVVSIGAENGINYIDLQIVGTTSATQYVINPEIGGLVAATVAQSWSLSSYVKQISGSQANISSITLGWAEQNSVPSFLVFNVGAVSVSSTGSLNTNRKNFSAAISQALTAFIRPAVSLFFNSGAAIDITLRIGLPQLEQGAFATSVIPTSTTAVTRSADVASITGSNFSSFYNQTEGTVFAEGLTAFGGYDRTVYEISASDFNNRIFAFQQVNNGMQTNVVASGASQAQMFPSPALVGAANKISQTYQVNNFASAVNGGTITTDAIGSVPTVDRLTIARAVGGSVSLNGTIKRLTYWPTRLANTTLVSITQP